MNALPALLTLVYDGWIMRFAGGYTNRANSISPLYGSTLALKEKIAYCENVYLKQGLPTVFKMTDATPSELHDFMESLKYKVVTPTLCMTNNSIEHFSRSKSVNIIQGISSKWLEASLKLHEIKDCQKRKIVETIMRLISNDVFCAIIEIDREIIACGRCVIERGYAGLYNIIVKENYRKRGFGYEICSSLLKEAKERGAKTAYLQVVENNSAGLSLYQKLGFKHGYKYWYRVKN